MAARIELRRDAGRLGPGDGPWIRERHLTHLRGAPTPSEPIEVVNKNDTTIGWGLWSGLSRIRVRMLSWGEAPPPPDWLEARIAAAHDARAALALPQTTGIRVINSEGDGLPGLIVDRYGDTRVVHLSTAAMVALRERAIAALRAHGAGPIHVIVPAEAARNEGVEPVCDLEGEPEALEFLEHGLSFHVPAPPAQKTGAYFDQRENRRWVAERLVPHGGRMLDVGCHAGGFALHACARGAQVVAVDRSAEVLAMAADNAARNGLHGITWVAADMFGPLGDDALAGPFHVIVADPPKVAARRGDLDAARSAMRRLVSRLVHRLTPNGVLVLCSCSHHFGRAQLDEVVARASTDPALAMTRIGWRGADVDHPIAPGHVEGEYLRVGIYQRRAPR